MTTSMSKAAGPSGFRPTNAWLAGVVLAVLTFWLFAQTLLNIIPVIQGSLGIADTIANFAVSITSLFAGCFIVVAGGLADRYGRVKMLRIGILASMLGSLLVALTPEQAGALTTSMLMGGRIVQGLSSAAIMPAALGLIKNYYEGAERQRAVSYFSIGTFGGSGLTALFGGAMASSPLGWRSIFWASVAICVLALFLTRGTPETRAAAAEHRGFDWAGLATFLVGIVSLNVFLSQGPKIGWASPLALVLAVLAVAGLAAFFVMESRRAENPFVDLSIFKNATFAGATLANFLINGTAGILLLTLSLMQHGAGWSPFDAGLLTLGYLVAVLTMIRVGEKLLQKWGRRLPMLIGSALVALGVLLNSLTFLPLGAYVPVVVLGFALFGVGLGFFATPATDAAIASVDDEKVGIAAAIFKMGSSLGNSIGITLGATAAGIAAAGYSGGGGGWMADGSDAAVRHGTMIGLWVVLAIALIALVSVAITVKPAARNAQ